MAEAVKHGLPLAMPHMLTDLLTIDPEQRDVPCDLLARNIAIKARVVEADEYETKDIRALLNFGHTIGHGIEASLPYGEMLHGEAIALGIRAALHISEKHSGLPPESSQKILSLLRHFNLPLTLSDSIQTSFWKSCRATKNSSRRKAHLCPSRPTGERHHMLHHPWRCHRSSH